MLRQRVFTDPQLLHEMLELFREGAGLSLLGKKYGVDHSTIYYHVRKVGLLKPEEVDVFLAKRRLLARTWMRKPFVYAPPPTGKADYSHLLFEPMNEGHTYATYQKLSAARKIKNKYKF